MLQIREALKQDFEQIWKIFQPIVSAGETYPYPRNTSKEEAFRIWIKEPQKTFVCLTAKNFRLSGKQTYSWHILFETKSIRTR